MQLLHRPYSHLGAAVTRSIPPLWRHVQPAERRRRLSISTNAAAKGVKPPELTGFWSSLVSEQLETFPNLNPGAAYLISHGVGHLLVPILEAYLVVTLLRLAASKLHSWCESNAEEQPLLSEMLELLPGALKGPTVVTLCTVVMLRMVHNAAFLLANYMYKFSSHVTYSKAADTLLNNLCNSLQPMGKLLLKSYSVMMLFYLTTVLVKWKSLGLSTLLEREREQQELLIAASGGVASKARSTDDLERLLVPFDAATSWLMYAVGFVAAAQVFGVDIGPLIAVGGAGGIIIGLATQQLLTNAFMGLSLFFTRPFVDGDSVLVQGAGNMVVSGVVERTTIMRTTLRTEDDVVVTIPNKTVADMIVFNRSAEVRRSRLASANRQTENIKLRLKLPYAQEDKLRELQELVRSVLEPPGSGTMLTSAASNSSAATATSSLDSAAPGSLDADATPGASTSASPVPAVVQAASASTRPSTPFGAALQSLKGMKPGPKPAVRSRQAQQPTHPVMANSVEVVISRFTDSGLELLVKAKLRVEPGNKMVQALLLDLSRRVRELGAMMVNV